MKIISPSALRNDLYNIVDKVMETNEPIFIKRKDKDLVLMTGDCYRSILNSKPLEAVNSIVKED